MQKSRRVELLLHEPVRNESTLLLLSIGLLRSFEAAAAAVAGFIVSAVGRCNPFKLSSIGTEVVRPVSAALSSIETRDFCSLSFSDYFKSNETQ